jgi:hypothetical protein
MEGTVSRSCRPPAWTSQPRQRSLALSFSHQLFYHILYHILNSQLLPHITLRYASCIAEHKGPTEEIQINPFLPQGSSSCCTSSSRAL